MILSGNRLNMSKFNSNDKYLGTEPVRKNEMEFSSEDIFEHSKEAGTNALCNTTQLKNDIKKEKNINVKAHSLKVNHLDDNMREVFCCKICPFRTIYFYRLRAHFWTHSTEENLAESICAFENSQTALYITHLLAPSTLEAVNESLNEHNLNKPSTHSSELVCSHCSYKTNEKSSLKDHILTHVEEKPFFGKLSPVVLLRPSHLEKSQSNDDNQMVHSPCGVVLTKAADDPMISNSTSEVSTEELDRGIINITGSEETSHCMFNITDDVSSSEKTNHGMINITASERISEKMGHGTINITSSKKSNDVMNHGMINITASEKSNLKTNRGMINIIASERPTVDNNHCNINVAASERSNVETNRSMINITASERSTEEAGVDPVVIMAVHEGLTILPRNIDKRFSDKLRIKLNKSQFKSGTISKSGNKIKTGDYHYCDICPYKSRNELHLKRHAMIHSDEKPFVCDVCPFRTKYLSSLKNHSLAHSGTQPYCCDQCSFKTTQMYNLKEHMLIHTGGKKYLCDICSYQSIRQSSFKNHLLRHTGEKPHSCHLCSFKTAAKCTLKRHLKNVHENSQK